MILEMQNYCYQFEANYSVNESEGKSLGSQQGSFMVSKNISPTFLYLY